MAAVSLDVGRGKLGMTPLMVCLDVRCQLFHSEQEE